jgi:hypothetical protein
MVPVVAGVLATSIGLTAMPASAATHSAKTSAAAAQAPVGSATASSTINQVIPGVGTLVGTFTPTRFTNQNGQLAVTGLVTGTLTTVTGAVVPVNQTVTTTVIGAAAAASCQILHLTLGPLDLILLGLMVHLDRVVLDITVQPGPGNLLGNLLCAIAGLLDGSGINGLAALLNRLLGL